MRKDEHIRQAIDESLGSVRFNAHDMRSVLRAVREQEAAPAPSARPRIFPRFAVLLTMLVLVPISFLTFRTLRDSPTITTITPLSGTTDTPAHSDPIVEPASTLFPAHVSAMTEDDAVRIARTCFESVCDTSVFSFEEYTVSVQAVFPYGGDPEAANYEVTMQSVYDNGCSFCVTISGKDGSVLSHSTPRLATVPTHLNADSKEIRAWYDKYGTYLFMWPLDAQAEFSRRYEGALLRMPQDGEVTLEYIRKRAPLFADSLIPDGGTVTVYPMLYDGAAFSDGQARYQIYCFPGGQSEETLPERYLLVTMLAADGTIESSELQSSSGL